MEDSENHDCILFAAHQLVNQYVGISPYEPFARPFHLALTSGLGKIAQELGSLANRVTDPPGGAWIPLVEIFLNREELRPGPRTIPQVYRPKRSHTSAISASVAIRPSRTSRLAKFTSAICSVVS